MAIVGPVEESKSEISEEQVKGVLEVVAVTGKFWLEWDKLKSILSFQLKQVLEVLSEYPEAKKSDEEQVALLGETYEDLMKRLDEALHSFDEGPPFTLQRLCEILLAARSIYSNLSKLALALEKNLLVTSTLTVCTDPYPQAIQKAEESNEASKLQFNSAENGVQPVVGDRDEVMTEAEDADADEDMTAHMEALEEVPGSSETNSESTGNS